MKSQDGQREAAPDFPYALNSLLPASALLVIGCVIPVVILGVKAFGGASLGHFQIVAYVTKPLHLRVLLNTLEISGFVAFLSLLLAIPLLFVLAHERSYLRTFVFVSLIGSMFLSTLVRSYVLTILLASDGWVVGSLRKLGIVSPFHGLLFTRRAVILAMIYVLLPFLLFIAYSSLKVNFVRLREIAAAQGASPSQYFVMVFLPHAIGGLTFGFLGTFVLATTFYITPELLGGGKGESMMLASLVAQQLYEFGDWSGAAALSLLLLTVVTGACGLLSGSWFIINRWQGAAWVRKS